MRLLELRLRNFRQHADTHIRFATGLTGIIGENGAGKSTLLEAIGWALYGAEATRGGLATLRHARAPADAPVEVELRFSHADQEYRVWRSTGSARVQVNGRRAIAGETDEAVTHYLERSLGLDRREFFNTYFTGQKELQFLASLGPTERGRFLSTILGYDRLRVAQDFARERRRELRTRVEALRASMPDEQRLRASAERAAAAFRDARTAARRTEEVAEAARSDLARVAAPWEVVQAVRHRYGELRGIVAAAAEQQAAIDREIEVAERELRRIEEAEAELQGVARVMEALCELRTEAQRLDELAPLHERRQLLTRQLRELDRDLRRADERIAQLGQAPELLQRYAAEISSARALRESLQEEVEVARTAWLRDRQDAETKLQGYRDRALELQEEMRRLRALGREGICPTCQRPLGEDHARLLATMEEQWAEVTQDGSWWRQRHDQLAKAPTDLTDLESRLREVREQLADRQRKHARCEAALEELHGLRTDRQERLERRNQLVAEIGALPDGYDQEAHRRMTVEVARLRKVEQRAAALEERLASKARWLEARAAGLARREQIEQRIADARAELAALNLSPERLETLRREVEAAEQRQRESEVAAAQARERLAAATEAARSARRAVEEMERQMMLLAEDLSALRHHEELDRSFTRLRADLHARVRPELGEIASELLGPLTDGRYSQLEIDKAFRIVLQQDGKPRPVISGGEEDIANLVVRISLSRMIAERAGHPLSLLVLDEVFGSLDEGRRDNVVRLLRRLGQQFDQVLLVTHLEEIRGAMDQVLRVELDDAAGRSVVRSEF